MWPPAAVRAPSRARCRGVLQRSFAIGRCASTSAPRGLGRWATAHGAADAGCAAGTLAPRRAGLRRRLAAGRLVTDGDAERVRLGSRPERRSAIPARRTGRRGAARAGSVRIIISPSRRGGANRSTVGNEERATTRACARGARARFAKQTTRRSDGARFARNPRDARARFAAQTTRRSEGVRARGQSTPALGLLEDGLALDGTLWRSLQICDAPALGLLEDGLALDDGARRRREGARADGPALRAARRADAPEALVERHVAREAAAAVALRLVKMPPS